MPVVLIGCVKAEVRRLRTGLLVRSPSHAFFLRAPVSPVSPMSYTDVMSVHDDDASLPEYRVTVTRSNTAISAGSSSSSVRWRSRFDDPPAPIKSVNLSPRFLSSDTAASANHRAPSRSKPERYIYTFNVHAGGGALLQFLVSVEPSNGKPVPGKYTFRLSLRVDKVERPLEDPVSLNLSVDPRTLEFMVFLFPGKSSLPEGSLYSYRVWLRANGIDHRLFGEDELWIAKDPDFNSIAEASFSRLKTMTPNMQIYDAYVGQARIQFIARWHQIADELYKYTLDYDANGVGGVLIEDFRLILQGDPRKVSFLIYTVPLQSMPAGASHRIRVWLKTLAPMNGDRSPTFSLPYNDSFTYQRIWKSDNFKIGARLDFQSLGDKMILAHSCGPPRTVVMPSSFKSDPTPLLG